MEQDENTALQCIDHVRALKKTNVVPRCSYLIQRMFVTLLTSIAHVPGNIIILLSI